MNGILSKTEVILAKMDSVLAKMGNISAKMEAILDIFGRDASNIPKQASYKLWATPTI